MAAALHRTTDPYLASFLWGQRAALVGCRRLGPKKVEYHFIAGRRLHNLLRLYWSNEPVFLVPSRLFALLQTLKSRNLIRAQGPF